MFEFYAFMAMGLLAALFVVLHWRRVLKLSLTLKILGLILAVVYGFRMYHWDAMNGVFNVLTVDLDTPIHAPSTWFFPVGMTVWMLFLRWVTIVAIVWALIGGFFKEQKLFHVLTGVFATLAATMNIFYFDENIIATTGVGPDALDSAFFIVQFTIESVLLGLVGVLYIVRLLWEKTRFTLKEGGWAIVVFFASMIALMPLSILYNLFGNYGEKPLDFNNEHIALIVFPFLMMVVIYFAMRKRSPESIYAMFMFMVFANIIHFYTYPARGLSGLPLHLCNTATILLLIAFVFRNNGFFYFSYFANVIGAMMAMIFPDYNHDLYTFQISRFMWTHYYPFIIPILAVALKSFPRPNLKMMFQAIGVFTVYFIAMVFINTWFRNLEPGREFDFFFAYSTHISSMFNAAQVHLRHYIIWNVGDYSFRFFYLFQPIYYICFVFLMFVNWFIYDLLFQSFDRFGDLKARQKEMALERRQLRKLLGGRSFDEPVNPDGVHMINIVNFSKRYKNSGILAVDDFSLQVHNGEVFGFLGQNGAGKSTTIKSLVGIQSITQGDMEVCGYNVKLQPKHAKLKIGFVSDNHAVYERMTGREYINYVADLYKVSQEDRDKRMNEYLQTLNLTHAVDTEIKSYSHGMKQKLVVIASLIHDPEIWILDEPLTGLDPTSAFQIKSIMRNYANQGRIVFFSSHVIEVVERICDRIGIINEGRLIGVYDVKDLHKKNIRIEDLYVSDEAYRAA